MRNLFRSYQGASPDRNWPRATANPVGKGISNRSLPWSRRCRGMKLATDEVVIDRCRRSFKRRREMPREVVGALIGADGLPTEKGTTPEPGGGPRIPSDLGLDTSSHLSPSSETQPPRRLCTTENLGHRQSDIGPRDLVQRRVFDGWCVGCCDFQSRGWPFSRRPWLLSPGCRMWDESHIGRFKIGNSGLILN
jgi:hypothetical protein